MRGVLILSAVLTLLVSSCQEQDSQMLAQVGEDKLFLNEVLLQMPLHYKGDDSVAFVQKQTDNWVNEQLLFQQGLRNVQNLDELERQVAQYRRDLIARTYPSERLAIYADEVSDDESYAFYEENKSQMRLKMPIIQGVFVQLPSKSNKAKDITNWLKQMQNGDMSNAEELEQYCLQRASYYDNFMEQWVDLTRLTDHLSMKIGEPARFLRRQVYQLKDNDYLYLFLITDFRLKGDEKPYEICHNDILELLVEKKQAYFRNQLQSDIREEALRTGLLKLK